VNSVPESFAAIYALLMLLPGFVSAFAERALAYEREPTGPLLIGKALMYSAITYVLFSLTRLPLIAWTVRAASPGKASIPITPDPWPMLLLLAIAVLVGVAAGALKTNDWHMKVARALRFTKRTSRSSLWLDLFQDIRGARSPHSTYVTVTLRDGRRLYGWPEYFADDFTDGPVLFITQAAWVRDSDSGEERVPLPGSRGILLRGDHIVLLQFHQ
jgi:hypothetical protein